MNLEFEPQYYSANSPIGSGDKKNLRNVYQEWLRTLEGLPDEDIEEITKSTFDKVGWEDKDEAEQRIYQERLERQIKAVKIFDSLLDAKSKSNFE